MISSKTNIQIKYFASLKEKKYREEYSKYLIEGIKLVDELLDSVAYAPEFVLYSPELLKKAAGGEKLLERIESAKIEKLEVTEQVLKYVSDTDSPQGVIAVMNIKKMDYDELKSEISSGSSFIILDKLSDAGNLGTIIRSAVTFGIKNIICNKGTVDAYNPKVVRSTMGAINKINIFYLEDTKFLNTIDILKNNGYEVIGTALDAKKYLTEYKPSVKTVYVIGNEASGMEEEVKKKCTENIKIKIEYNQESLNASIAAGIVLYDRYIRGENSASKIKG